MANDIQSNILALGSWVIDAEIKVRTLSRILVEKKVATIEEIEEEYKLTAEKDFDALKADLLAMIEKYAQEDNKTSK